MGRFCRFSPTTAMLPPLLLSLSTTLALLSLGSEVPLRIQNQYSMEVVLVFNHQSEALARRITGDSDKFHPEDFTADLRSKIYICRGVKSSELSYDEIPVKETLEKNPTTADVNFVDLVVGRAYVDIYRGDEFLKFHKLHWKKSDIAGFCSLAGLEKERFEASWKEKEG